MQIQAVNRYTSAQAEVKNYSSQKPFYSLKAGSNVNTDRIAFGRKCAPQTFELFNELIELLENKHKIVEEKLKGFYKVLEDSSNIEIDPEVLPKNSHIHLKGQLKGENLSFKRALGGTNAIPEYTIKIGNDKEYRFAVLGQKDGHLDRVARDGRVKTTISISNEEEQDLHPYLNAILKGDWTKKLASATR